MLKEFDGDSSDKKVNKIKLWLKFKICHCLSDYTKHHKSFGVKISNIQNKHNTKTAGYAVLWHFAFHTRTHARTHALNFCPFFRGSGTHIPA